MVYNYIIIILRIRPPYSIIAGTQIFETSGDGQSPNNQTILLVIIFLLIQLALPNILVDFN
jgi:hypothetical protein